MSQAVINIMDAIDFAMRKHSDQRRKGHDAQPYINHLIEVSTLVTTATQGQNTNAIMAAVLHDVIEDQNVTHAELAAKFGTDVANLVAEVTDDTSLPRQERRQKQVDSMLVKSPEAKMIKIADKISNLRSMVTSPPEDWSHQERLDYVEFSKKVVVNCQGANPHLEQLFQTTYQNCIQQLKPMNNPYINQIIATQQKQV